MNHDKFCSAPWLDLSISPTAHYSLCCVADHTSMEEQHRVPVSNPIELHWNGNFMKGIRTQFIAGQIPSICHNCIRDESVDLISKRQKMNQRYIGQYKPTLDHPIIKELLDSTNNDGHSLAPLQGVDISLGNTCQLRCIQCSPSFSRSILKDYDKLGWKYNDKNRMPIIEKFQIINQNQPIIQALDNVKDRIQEVKWVRFGGGEPTITKPLLEFLDWCIEHGHNNRIILFLSTNGVSVSETFISKLKKFKRVILAISLDGVGPLDEWIRYPTRWARKEKNIEKLIKEFPDAYIDTTLFSLNIHELSVIINWCKEHGYRHNIHRLNWPECFDIQHLPDTMKKEISEHLSLLVQQLPVDRPDDRDLADSQLVRYLSGIIDLLNSSKRDENKWQECLSIIRDYNSIRPKNFQDLVASFQKYV
jgi:molybdenum cofactor biosynthesis enzyme MoaA